MTRTAQSAVLRVINPGALATLQDRGRMGYQRYGVPQSGAMDMLTFAIACMLVGNPLDEAAIEFTLMGGTYALESGACRAAVAGAFAVTLNGTYQFILAMDPDDPPDTELYQFACHKFGNTYVGYMSVY